MRLVLSFCEKDKAIALKSIQWAQALDGTIDAPTLLCHDDSTDAESVLSVARDVFTNLSVFTHRTFKPMPWPRIQNRVFQEIARHITTLEPLPWFWWEPDLTPLKSGWWKTIANAHASGGKPFSGFITANAKNMTGCGVYPPDFPTYSVRGMLADKAAWDLMMWKDIHNKVNRINHILQHHYLIEGAAPTFPTVQSLALLRDEAVTFHRCKDGSLVDRLMEGRKSETVLARIVQTVKQTVTGVSNKRGVIVYIPPPGIGHSDIFLKHITEYPPKNQLVMLSDHAYPNSIRISNPAQYASGSNAIASIVFLHALRHAERLGMDYFIYLETDCRVKGNDWDVQLFEEFCGSNGYIAGGNLGLCNVRAADSRLRKEFMAMGNRYGINSARHPQHNTAILTHKYPTAMPTPFVNGAVAVYSVKGLRDVVGQGTTEEIMERGFSCQDRSVGEFALKRYEPLQALGKFKHMPQVMATAGEEIYPFKTRVDSLNRGNVTCVHPIKGRWRPAPSGGYSFYHSGDLGDIIYALKAIKLIGGGSLVLGTEHKSDHPPRSPIRLAAYESLAPLLKRQAYLTSVEFSGTYRECIYDFNKFRDFWNGREKSGLKHNTLAEMHCYTVGVDQLFTPEPWLVADSKTISPIIIHRSARYNVDFPWPEILRRHGKSSVFVGLAEEHRTFVQKYGNIGFYQAKDVDDLASVINGAQFFIGNQSLPCAIALGLGKNVYQETWYVRPHGGIGSPDCLFNRPNFFNQKNPLEVIKWTA